MTRPVVRSTLRALHTAVAISWRADRRRYLATACLSTLVPFSVVWVAWWLKVLVDAAAAADLATALAAAAALSATGALGRLAGWTSTRLFFPLKEHTGLYLDRRLIELSTGIAGTHHHERPEYLDQIETLRQESHVLASGGNTAVAVLAVIIQAAATGVLLASVNPLLLLVPVFALPSFWAGARAERLRQSALDDTAEQRRAAQHLFELATSPAPGKELRVFGLGEEFLVRHRRLNRTIDSRLDGAGRRGLLWTAAGWSVFALGYAGALVVVVNDAVAGTVTLGDVVLALALLARINLQVAAAVGTTSALARMMRVAGRYLWLVDYAADQATEPGQEPPARLHSGIELRGLGFRYPGTDTDVLADVDLVLPAGTTVALVGENGAGKSTLVKLLCRFYQPSAGHILVDGVNLADLDVEAWRARLSGGFQDFARLELLAREAVGVGDLDRLDDLVAVEEALERAASTDLADALAQGLETRLGASYDGGTELSGGQWQKLALGRAMMRRRPLLVVLDEPTAAVDAETEHALFERYAAAAATLGAEVGTVTVLVSHRFSTVRMAQLIVVVDAGRVVEAGSHAELVAAGGLYAELHELQARSYR